MKFKVKKIVKMKKKDWSGLTHNGEHLFSVRNGSFQINKMTMDGALLRELRGDGWDDVEDIVHVSDCKFLLVEEKKMNLALIHFCDKTKKVDKSKARVVNFGKAAGNRGLEGLAIDHETGDIFVGKEKRPAIWKINKSVFDGLEAFTIDDSVGEKGKNIDEDVKQVQLRLNRLGELPKILFVPGRINRATIDAIERLQKKIGFSSPDGRVDPNGRTHDALMGRGWKRPVAFVDVTRKFLNKGRVKDLSGLHVSDGKMFILSHESKEVVICNLCSGEELCSIKLVKGENGLKADIPQAEGITTKDGKLFIVSEGNPNKLYIFEREE